MLGSGSYNSALNIRLRYLARHLADTWDITIVTPSADKYNDFTPDRLLAPAFARLIQPWQLTTRSAMLNLLPYLCSSVLPILRARAAAVLIYKPTPITVLGLLPKLLSRTPVVVDLDDLGGQVMRDEGRSRLSYSLVDWSERLCTRYADAVVVASTELRAHVQRVHPGKPVLLSPNAVEPSEYSVVAESKVRNVVYYFGAINRLGLIQDLLQAMPAVLRQVPDTRLIVIGGGRALDEAKQMSRALGIESAADFPGWQADMLAVQDYTQYADIGVCYLPDTPSVRAASNMKVFQYMAMGTVPLVSDVGDLRSYLRDGQAGVVVPSGNPDALAAELIELLRDDRRRVRLAQEAWQLARGEHSWHARSAALGVMLGQLTELGEPHQEEAKIG
jgi:glycosyltransferase involved in cell wall biosynthesis